MRRRRATTAVLFSWTLALLAGGCRATGRTANRYFDWGGRTFTSNPASQIPYYLGFGAFFIGGLPLDLLSWIAVGIGWSGSEGDDYRGAALAPSIFLGTTGGVILGAPFFPIGLPWWRPDEDEDDHERQPKAPERRPDVEPIPVANEPGADVPAGAPR